MFSFNLPTCGGNGFTLIEILIVIVLISIISGVALVTVSSNSKKQLETFSKKISRVITLAEQEAMLRPATLGIAFSEDYFQFYQYQPNDKKENAWHALPSKSLGFQPIPSHIRLSISVNQEHIPYDGKPHIIISESGDITPFTMTVASRDNKPDYVVKGEASGNIHVEVYREQ